LLAVVAVFSTFVLDLIIQVYGNSNDNAQLSCVNGIKNNAVIETQSQSHITSEINSSGLKSQSNLGRN
jgi:hypothetical protein